MIAMCVTWFVSLCPVQNPDSHLPSLFNAKVINSEMRAMFFGQILGCLLEGVSNDACNIVRVSCADCQTQWTLSIRQSTCALTAYAF